ncbi:MAG: hypothetical protein IPM50_02500 [Acidobacteriota bacterium]|nr:MAG: hypothetical protein IPM50_02500 [Acidobacteriota bacterium]
MKIVLPLHLTLPVDFVAPIVVEVGQKLRSDFENHGRRPPPYVRRPHAVVTVLMVTSVAAPATNYHSKKAAQAGAPVNRPAWVIAAIVVIAVVSVVIAIIVIAIISIVAAIVVAAVAVINRLPHRLLVHAAVVVAILADVLSAVTVTSTVLCVGSHASEAQKGDAKDREHYAAS